MIFFYLFKKKYVLNCSVILEKLLNKLTKQFFYGSAILVELLKKQTDILTFYYFDTKSKTILSMVQLFRMNY